MNCYYVMLMVIVDLVIVVLVVSGMFCVEDCVGLFVVLE